MNEKTIYLFLALVGGAVIPVQIALNSLLRGYVGEAMQVTFISFLAGTLTSFIVCLIAQYQIPQISTLTQTSWWMWIGGCLGTLYVLSTILATPKIGAAFTLALTIAGQMIIALFLDHYGAIGLTKQAANPTRITGVVLVILGVSLVAYTKK